MANFKWFAIACIGLPMAAPAQGAVDTWESDAHWGTEAGIGYSYVPNSIAGAAQSRYTATASGLAYNFGLVRFHANGAPSFSLQFVRASYDGSATDRFDGLQYKGSAVVTGFMATKHVNFLARRRVSFGVSFGGGIGPQFKANYKPVDSSGAIIGGQKTYTLDQIPVTPLFEMPIRADVRLTRTLSIGPWGGIRPGIPVLGGVLRVHFLKP